MPLLSLGATTSILTHLKMKTPVSDSNTSVASGLSRSTDMINTSPVPRLTGGMSKIAKGANVISLITTKLTSSTNDLVSKSANALSAKALSAPVDERNAEGKGLKRINSTEVRDKGEFDEK
jgi:hypothetical protein